MALVCTATASDARSNTLRVQTRSRCDSTQQQSESLDLYVGTRKQFYKKRGSGGL